MTLFVFFSIVAFLLYIQAGVFLFLRKPVAKINRLFAYMLFSLAWVSLFLLLIQFSNEVSDVYLIDRINMFGWLALPLLTVLFFVNAANVNRRKIFYLVSILASLAAVLMVRYIWHPQSMKHFYEGSSGMWYYSSNIQSGWVILAVIYNLGCAYTGLAVIWRFFVKSSRSQGNKKKFQSKVFLLSFSLFLLISISSHIVFPLMDIAAFPAMIHFAALPMVGTIFLSTLLLHPQTFFKEMISRIFIRRIKEFVFFIDHNGRIYSVNQYSLDVLNYSLSDMINKEPEHFLKPSGMVTKKMEDVIMNYKTDNLVCLLKPKQGASIPVSLNITKVYDSFRNIIGFLLIASDYRQTQALHKQRKERRLAEQKLIARNLELEKRINERSTELIKIQRKLTSEHARQKEAENQILIELRNKEEILRELHHRVKNNIQMIISLINMEQGRLIAGGQSEAIYGSIANRIRTISMIHDYLYDAPYMGKINLKGFVEKIIGELRGVFPGKSYVRINTSFKHSILSVDKAIPCGIIIFELLSNAFHHAFRDIKDLDQSAMGKSRINIDFVSENHKCLIHIHDNGEGIALRNRKPEQKRIGLSLVELLVSEYLKGSIHFLNLHGTVIWVDFECAEKQCL